MQPVARDPGPFPDRLDRGTGLPNPFVPMAVTYRRLLNSPGAGAAHLLVAAAHEIYADDNPTRWELEARLLTNEPIEQIAERVGGPVDVIELYMRRFFDVRADDGGLRGPARLRWQIADEVASRGELLEPMTWKILALIGGSVPLDIVIGDYRGRRQQTSA